LKKPAFRTIAPALAISALLIAAFLVPSRGTFPFNGRLVACAGYGYGYGYTGGPPSVTGVSPSSGSIAGGTTVSITGFGYCNFTSSVNFGTTPAASFAVQSDTLILAVSPAHAAGAVDVTVTNALGVSATSNADQFTFTNTPASSGCSRTQYRLTGSDGSTWVTMDSANLSRTVTPSVDSYWILTGNADLWTSSLGFNQDLGIQVVGGTGPSYPTTTGQPEAWKESGGTGGTFSPNAAAVQTVIFVKAGNTYGAVLQWKANQPDSGTIWAGAGPVAGQFSETCLNSQLVPVSPTTIATKVSTQQYSLTGNSGSTWVDMDATNLSLSITAPADGMILLTANSDLWTSVAGVNQDIAITVGSAISAWKESGGSAGTFSPNAAFVQSVIPAANGTTYTAKIQWKAQQSTSGTIYAGAGPIGSKFSPTRLTALFLPTAQKAIDKVSTLQYWNQNSNGAFWASMDSTRLSIPFTATANCTVVLSGNVDLWTASGGINQDIGIVVVDTSFPTAAGQPEGWKESGGSSGTFSPNAAYIQIVVSLTAGKSYSVDLVWKANQPNSGTIYAGAGPIGGAFSPTRLTLQPIGC